MRDHITKWKPSFIRLVETKVKEHKSFRITRCLPHNWNTANNYTFHSKGRIWVAWDPNIWDCKVISVSDQHITSECMNKGGLIVHITMVYGANYHSQRSSLWNELSSLSGIIFDSPWGVLGDFTLMRSWGKDSNIGSTQIIQ